MKIRTRTAKELEPSRPALWKLAYLDAAASDARRFLTEDQYAHVVQQFDDLAASRDPRRSETQDVRPIDDWYELREKGGLLGKINVRVYFAVLDARNLLVILACYKKEDEGQTAKHIMIKVRNRLRQAKKILEETERG